MLRSSLHYFYHWESTTPDAVFLRQPFGKNWKTLTYGEAGQEARKVATFLQNSGLEPGTHIGILSKNCFHWILADLAIMIGGFVSVPFYASLTNSQLNEVLELGDVDMLFAGKLDHWDGSGIKTKRDLKIIRFPHYAGNAEVNEGELWDELVENNTPLSGNPHPDWDKIWSIIFTSGTTGTPKGVVHDFRNNAVVIKSVVDNDTLDIMDFYGSDFFSFLPLNHIAERTVVEMGVLIKGGTVSFAESLVTFSANLQEVQPHLFFAVPRIWTKFQEAILIKIPETRLKLYLSIPIFGNLLKKAIRKKLGLGRARVIITGASITPESLKQWYRRLGIHLREAYGLTENMGGFSLMPKDKYKPNTVGKPVADAEGRIHPESGEILIKVPWLMKGYYKDPEKTAEVIVDGWLHTGDRGEFDQEGFLKIMGRVRDTFKTSKGKFINPSSLENHFTSLEIIDQICICGLGLAQPLGLIMLSQLAWSKSEKIISQKLKDHLTKVNEGLHPHEKISTLVILSKPWTVENNLLTPTLKIRRGAIQEFYAGKWGEWEAAPNWIVWEKDL